MTGFYKYACLLFLGVALFSCSAPRHVSYFQNAASFGKQPVEKSYKVNIQNDDLISIMVASKDTDLAVPFNKLNPDGTAYGYLVDAKGEIDFPLLGTLQVTRQTTDGLALLLKKRLISEGYIKDPTVIVRLLNFKVSVIGEVTKPGVFPVSTERITILEAIGMAGDLSIYGKRDKILVVREKDGEREMHYLDIQSTDLLSSPYYYLQQNDVVYVEPNKAKAMQGDYKTRVLPLVLSGVSVLASIASVLILVL
ncbi:polysaccharide export protein [Chitinophaga sp. G-6-1-13]|uniref:Polysaccharide export protein n=1 Tax=Chitinophaga fulva TaxID=2728842 RepID=A0A848GHG6_9BACT|nr:polysaccharide biosynthesis/export family protein [Chitinophaga fulva]NML37257.1 polysaccharide export protein [Chitinophaga fulva]